MKGIRPPPQPRPRLLPCIRSLGVLTTNPFCCTFSSRTLQAQVQGSGAITEPRRPIWMAEGSLEVALLPFKPRDKPVTLLRWLLFHGHAFARGMGLIVLV